VQLAFKSPLIPEVFFFLILPRVHSSLMLKPTLPPQPSSFSLVSFSIAYLFASGYSASSSRLSFDY
jgi:hypothetical protein